MNKQELVSEVSKRSGVKQADVDSVINHLQDAIIEHVRDGGDNVSLPKIGIFKQKVTAAHVGRNPLTGQSINVPDSRTIKMQISASIKKLN